MKVICDDKIPYIRKALESLADVVIYKPGKDIAPDDVRDADALIVRTRTRCDQNLLDGSRVQIVITATIGYDHIDTEWLDTHGIRWTNCPGCNATSVAQWVRESLKAVTNHNPQSPGAETTLPSSPLSGTPIPLSRMTLGIVGYGHVGKAVAAAMRPLVKEIIINDPPLFNGSPMRGRETHATSNPESSHPTAPTTSLPDSRIASSLADLAVSLPDSRIASSLTDLAASCDIITFHTPLTYALPYPTHHLADTQFFNALKPGAIILNAARGGVIDEEALLHALQTGKVSHAIIDTWENEPDINPRLLQAATIATPHIAGYSADGKANASRMAVEALARHFHLTPDTSTIVPPPATAPYRPQDDDAALRNNPAAFETLRSNYPVRRD